MRKPRPASETTRIYGSKARIAFVKALPCRVPLCFHAPSENAHTTTGGMGRKADAATIVPLCARHHRELHHVGVRTFEATYSVDLERAAVATEAKWQAHCESKASK